MDCFSVGQMCHMINVLVVCTNGFLFMHPYVYYSLDKLSVGFLMKCNKKQLELSGITYALDDNRYRCMCVCVCA